MSNQTIILTEPIYQYLLAVSLREAPLLHELRDETARLSSHEMQIAPEQGQFLALLVELIGAKKTLEVGVYTGYSSLSVAFALPSDGKIVACDINPEWTQIARNYWDRAGVSNKIDLYLAPAEKTLNQLIDNGEAGSYDFAFIDADKRNYENYYERTLTLLRQGGLIAVDNTLWGGELADFTNNDKDTIALRAFNKKILADPRVTISLVPIGDGLTLARKR
jgi:predicted O-methyltransferase YrrM